MIFPIKIQDSLYPQYVHFILVNHPNDEVDDGGKPKYTNDQWIQKLIDDQVNQLANSGMAVEFSNVIAAQQKQPPTPINYIG